MQSTLTKASWPRRRATLMFGTIAVALVTGCGSEDHEPSPEFLAEKPMTFGGIGDIVVGMSEAELASHGVKAAPTTNTANSCSFYEEGAYGRVVHVYVKGGVVIGVNGQYAIHELSGGSTVSDIKAAFPVATFESSTNGTLSNLIVSEPAAPERYLGFSIRSEAKQLRDSDKVISISSGTEDFVVNSSNACLDSSPISTSSPASSMSGVTTPEMITFGGLGDVVVGTRESELRSMGLKFGSELDHSDGCLAYPLMSDSGSVWVEDGAVVGAVGITGIRGISTGMTAAQVKDAFAGENITEVRDIAAPLIVSDPRQPTMYLGFLFEEQIGELTDNDVVTQIRGGSREFVSTFLSGCS